MKLQKQFFGALLFTLSLPAALATGPYDLANYGPDSAIDEIWPFQDGLAAIQIGGKWGFINRDGKLVVQPQFEEPSVFVNGLASVQTNEGEGHLNKEGYLNKDGTWKIPPKYQMAFNFGKTAALVQYPNQTWALIDRDGKDIYTFPPELDPHGDFEQGVLRVKRNYPQQLRHLDGRTVTLPIGTSLHDWQSHLGDGLIGMSQLIRGEYKIRMGFVDPQGKWVIPPKFDEVSQFRHGVALVKEGERSGLINTRGEWAFKPNGEQDLRRIEANGMYLVTNRNDTIAAIFSREGRKLHGPVSCILEPNRDTANNWFMIGNAECSALKILTNDGKLADLPFLPTSIENASSSTLFLLKGYQPDPLNPPQKPMPGEDFDDRDIPEDTHFAIIDAQGKILVDSTRLAVKGKLGYVELFRQDKAATHLTRLPLGYFEDEAGVHILTPDGKAVTNPEWSSNGFGNYNLARDQAQGPLIVQTRRGWGAIDASGKWLIEPGFDQLSSFKFGIAQVRQHQDDFLVDTSGKRIDYPKGEDFSIIAPNTLYLQDATGPKFYNLQTGEVTLQPDADPYTIEFHNGLTPMNKNELYGLINAQGKWVAAPVYSNAPVSLRGPDGQHLGWKTMRNDGLGEPHNYRYGFLTADGKEALKPIYKELELDASKRLIAKLPYRDTFVFDLQGKELLRGENIVHLGEGWYGSQKTSDLGFMNEAGKWVVEPLPLDDEVYFRDYPFSGASIQGETVFIDSQGRVSTRQNPQPHTLPDTPENWLPLTDTHAWITTYYGFDWQPRLRVQGSSEPFVGKVAQLNRFNPDQYGLIDGQGKFVLPMQDSRLGQPKDGYVVIERILPDKFGKQPDDAPLRKRRYGYLDQTGKPVIPSRFEGAQPFSEGRAGVVVNGNIGIIDTKGKLIVHSGWQCSVPVLLDANRKVIWTTKPGCKEPIKTLPPKELRCPNCHY